MSGYFPLLAHDETARRRQRLGKLHRDESLAAKVISKLKDAWSPEQIAGRLCRDGEARTGLCHETIYQYIYNPAGRATELFRHLPCQRRKRRARYARKPRGLHIPEANTIAKRPVEISMRTSFGHWECDLVGFRQEFGTHKITSLVERLTRYTFLQCNPSRHSQRIMAGISRDLAPFPMGCRQSITFDRGTEFTAYPLLKRTLGIESYFCAPKAPWQKGTVENTNGRLRRFLPLDTDISKMTDEELAAITRRMNATPRKCLGYRTPSEVFNELLTKHPPPATISGTVSHFG